MTRSSVHARDSEALEDEWLVLRCDPHTRVGHLEEHLHAGGVARGDAPRESHEAARRELEGVPKQVEQHLFDTHRVAHQLERLETIIHHQLQVERLLERLRANKLDGLLQDSVQLRACESRHAM